MARKDDYGLPDETLQLIAAAPSIFAGNKYLQPRMNLSSRQDPSQLIAALRASGTDNHGFTQYANSANADSASARTARRGLFAPSRLTMSRASRPTTPVPSTQPVTPTTRTPQVMGPLQVNLNSVVPVDPVAPPPVTPVSTAPANPVSKDSLPSIYTKPIVSDIPDVIDPNTIPLIVPEFPLELPEIPDIPEKTGVVEIYPGDTVIPEVVGPRKGGGGDLPEDFDKYLVGNQPVIESGSNVVVPEVGGGSGGSSKEFDPYLNEMLLNEFFGGGGGFDVFDMTSGFDGGGGGGANGGKYMAK